MKLQPCPGRGLTPVLPMASDAAQSIFDEQTFVLYCEDDTGNGHLRYVPETYVNPTQKEIGPAVKEISCFSQFTALIKMKNKELISKLFPFFYFYFWVDGVEAGLTL